LNEWVKKAGAAKKEESTHQTASLRAENRELQEKIAALEKENARIKKENEFLEDARELLRNLQAVIFGF